MPDAREARFAAGSADPILYYQVTAIHAHRDPVTEECHNSMSWGERTQYLCAGFARLGELMYGLRSCHWRSYLLWWSGARSVLEHRRVPLNYTSVFLAVPIGFRAGEERSIGINFLKLRYTESGIIVVLPLLRQLN